MERKEQLAALDTFADEMANRLSLDSQITWAIDYRLRHDPIGEWVTDYDRTLIESKVKIRLQLPEGKG